MKKSFSFLLVSIIIFLVISNDFTLTKSTFHSVNSNNSPQVKITENLNSVIYSNARCCNNMDPRYGDGQQWYIDCSETSYLFIDSTCCVNIWAYYNYTNPPASIPCSLVLYLCPVEFE